MISVGPATKATVDVHGIVAGVAVPFPVDDPDGCADKGMKCPLVKDSEYKYQQALPVKSAYPKVCCMMSLKGLISLTDVGTIRQHGTDRALLIKH